MLETSTIEDPRLAGALPKLILTNPERMPPSSQFIAKRTEPVAATDVVQRIDEGNDMHVRSSMTGNNYWRTAGVSRRVFGPSPAG